MKLGSHNTFTYLPVKQWYLKPFAFAARCQEVDIWQQYALGARLFDLRVRFDKNDRPVICHGLVKYKCSNTFIEDTLYKLNKCKGICVRVILETHRKNSRQENLFRTFCSHLEKTYYNLNFFGGQRKFNWTKVYYFSNGEEDLDDKYSSTTSLFKSSNNFLRIMDDLYPKYYAKKLNKVNIANGTTHKWLFIDFVNIR